ncbi:MAG: FtsW/RodA/SpoVE family cell cycle protein [Lachnospiraceae bacterium]|nr:FtsW/RodA/SpoVE family cell cycle protein [Lachnospiraceae bacterium]
MDRERSDVRVIRQPNTKKSGSVFRAYDYSLLFLTVFLVGLGCVFVYSSSSYTASLSTITGFDGTYYLKRQGLFGAFGILVMVLISRIDYKLYTKPFPKFRFRAIYLLYIICVALQVLVFVPGIGTERGGAKRWILIPYIGTFQPSEVTKICVIVFVAFIAALAPKALNYFGGFIRAFIYTLPFILLVGKEDLSTAVVIAGIFFVICFVASKKYVYFVVTVILALGAIAGYIFLGDSFRADRIEAWRNVDTSAVAYQIRRGLYAISSGGFIGKGLGNGSMKLGYVPESHNDMIFSIICEELGVFGAISIILLFILLLWRILVVALNAPDLFGSLLCVGVFAHIALQVVMNIAVVTNSVPATGIALPFISYGGTSLVLLLCEVGMVLSVSYRIENKE